MRSTPTAIDLIPAFRAATRNGRNLYLDFWHPSAAGHREAAEEIVTQLDCDGLLLGAVPHHADACASP